MTQLERVKLARTLIKRGMTDDEIVDCFRIVDEFDERTTRGGIELIRRSM